MWEFWLCGTFVCVLMRVTSTLYCVRPISWSSHYHRPVFFDLQECCMIGWRLVRNSSLTYWSLSGQIFPISKLNLHGRGQANCLPALRSIVVALTLKDQFEVVADATNVCLNVLNLYPSSKALPSDPQRLVWGTAIADRMSECTHPLDSSLASPFLFFVRARGEPGYSTSSFLISYGMQ